jgi:hypothetical protein
MKPVVKTVAVVALAGAAVGVAYLIFKKIVPYKPVTVVYPTYAQRVDAARMANDTTESAYECNDFNDQCTEGDVGGCIQYEDTCRSAQSVRSSGVNTAQGKQECQAFMNQCVDGSYTSCNLYMRGCQYEE